MSTGRTYSLLSLVVVDRVATVTIERPDALNSLNPALVHQLQQAMSAAIDDPAVDAILLAAAGKTFVVGADIGFFLRNLEAGDIDRIVRFTEAGHEALNLIDRSPKPVVAIVAGLAAGGGVELALACDAIVATPAASFSLPETGLGIYPGLGGTQRTSRRVGVGLAKWMIFTGRTVSATEAAKIGLVTQLVAPELVEATARELALAGAPRPTVALSDEYQRLASFFATQRASQLRAGTATTANDPALVRAMKQVANKAPLALDLAEQLIEQGAALSLEEGLRLELSQIGAIFRTQDARTGIESRAKKQLAGPVFAGR